MSNVSIFRDYILDGASNIEVASQDRDTAVTLLFNKANSIGLLHPECKCRYYYEEMSPPGQVKVWLDGLLITYPEDIRQEVLDNMKQIEESKNAS